MYQFKRILVALDFTEMDEVLIKYTSHLAQKTQADKVYFFHIANNFDIPQELKDDYPDLLVPTDESLSALMKDHIKEHWVSKYDCDQSIELKEGNPTRELLKWVDNKQIDLIIMGRKKKLSGSGVMPTKISNLAHCSIMLVPEKAEFSLKKVVVPIDFSSHSKLSVETALEMVENENADLSYLHVFNVPTGYHKTGKTYEEVAYIMQNIAKKNFDKFLKKNKLPADSECKMLLDDDNSPSDRIFEYASEIKADLILMGSKGRTGIASILLGSVASKLIKYDTTIPLLIVKEKEENMGFLQALLKI